MTTQKELILMELEAARNFIRGAAFDPRLPHDIKEAFCERAEKIDQFIDLVSDGVDDDE